MDHRAAAGLQRQDLYELGYIQRLYSIVDGISDLGGSVLCGKYYVCSARHFRSVRYRQVWEVLRETVLGHVRVELLNRLWLWLRFKINLDIHPLPIIFHAASLLDVQHRPGKSVRYGYHCSANQSMGDEKAKVAVRFSGFLASGKKAALPARIARS